MLPISSPGTVTSPAYRLLPLAMGVGDDASTTFDQYPGSNLSISQLCHALKAKLAQAKDSRYANIIAPLLFQRLTRLTPDIPFPSLWCVFHGERGPLSDNFLRSNPQRIIWPSHLCRSVE